MPTLAQMLEPVPATALLAMFDMALLTADAPTLRLFAALLKPTLTTFDAPFRPALSALFAALRPFDTTLPTAFAADRSPLLAAFGI
jgi:hypothetical protein